jgi:fructokinase
MSRLLESHVDTSVTARASQNTVLALVNLEKGRDPHYLFYTEGTAEAGLQASDLPDTGKLDLEAIVFGSISLLMHPLAETIEGFVMREQNRLGKRLVISLDPNARPMMIGDRTAFARRFEGWLALSTIAKVSQPDYEFIWPGLSLEDAMKKSLSLGPALSVATLGADGSVALLKRPDNSLCRVTAPVMELPVVDTIGAGDTFHGALMAWLQKRGKLTEEAITGLAETELRDALVFANTAASIVCSRQGCDPPTLNEVFTMSEENV